MTARGHVLLRDVPGSARPCSRAASRRPWRACSSASSSRPTCCPWTSRAPTSSTCAEGLRVPAGAGVHQHPPGRRDQPRHAEDPERAARGDGGAPGHRRGRDPPLDEPLPGLATMNPLDHEGTYPLPAAQLDRFMMMLSMGYPGDAEVQMLNVHLAARRAPRAAPARHHPRRLPRLAAHGADDVPERGAQALRRRRRAVAPRRPAQPPVDLAALHHPARARGAGRAMLRGRDYVTAEDVQTVAPDVSATACCSPTGARGGSSSSRRCTAWPCRDERAARQEPPRRCSWRGCSSTRPALRRCPSSWAASRASSRGLAGERDPPEAHRARLGGAAPAAPGAGRVRLREGAPRALPHRRRALRPRAAPSVLRHVRVMTDKGLGLFFGALAAVVLSLTLKFAELGIIAVLGLSTLYAVVTVGVLLSTFVAQRFEERLAARGGVIGREFVPPSWSRATASRSGLPLRARAGPLRASWCGCYQHLPARLATESRHVVGAAVSMQRVTLARAAPHAPRRLPRRPRRAWPTPTSSGSPASPSRRPPRPGCGCSRGSTPVALPRRRAPSPRRGGRALGAAPRPDRGLVSRAGLPARRRHAAHPLEALA
jgi:hypothetical protein